MEILNEICTLLQQGRAPKVKELITEALDMGINAQEILEKALLPGMSVIGEKFKNNEIFVPEVLIAARAMNAGTEILKPHLVSDGVKSKGVAVIGTVKGDLHDIGKNLVKMMMESRGLEVIDLGVDVSPETYINTAIEKKCNVICCSALLTTTMPVMQEIVNLAEERNIRPGIKIMIGGAPVTEDFCKRIGADYYTQDATAAADTAFEICTELLKLKE